MWHRVLTLHNSLCVPSIKVFSPFFPFLEVSGERASDSKDEMVFTRLLLPLTDLGR